MLGVWRRVCWYSKVRFITNSLMGQRHYPLIVQTAYTVLGKLFRLFTAVTSAFSAALCSRFYWRRKKEAEHSGSIGRDTRRGQGGTIDCEMISD